MKMNDLYDLSHTLAAEYLAGFSYPWQALSGIKELIRELGPKLGGEYSEIAPEVWVHSTAKVAPTAYLGAPCIIGPGTEVRHCAFVRGSALVGEGCVVGNSVELKNVILFDGVQVPRFFPKAARCHLPRPVAVLTPLATSSTTSNPNKPYTNTARQIRNILWVQRSFPESQITKYATRIPRITGTEIGTMYSNTR